VKGQICYLWAAVDVDTNEILAVYASWGRGIPSAIEFLRKVLDSCEGKPVIVVDRGPWYRWALERLGVTFGKRNRIERWFREMKGRTKYCQVGITSSPTALIMLCIIAIAVTNSSMLFNFFEFALL
jgi:transposase-like protein